MRLKIVTFNTQHMRDYRFKDGDRIDMARFAGYIAASGADIVGLNEVRGQGVSEAYADQVNIVGEQAGYAYRYFAEAIKVGGENPYGNALLSKQAFDAETVRIPDPAVREPDGKWFESRCVLRATFDFSGKPLTVLTTHFGLNPSEAMSAAATVCRIADETPGAIVLMGDFNLHPDSPILDGIRQRFFDTETLLPAGNHFTFPSDAPEEKIDYIFVRDARALSAYIDGEIVSDHLSMGTVIEF